MNAFKSILKPVFAWIGMQHGFFLWFLMAMIIISALTVVSLENSIRGLEKQYHKSLSELYEKREEAGILMLEKSHLETPTRIEVIAKEKLGMRYPDKIEVIYLDSNDDSSMAERIQEDAIP
jgi:cell division protein FtsL